MAEKMGSPVDALKGDKQKQGSGNYGRLYTHVTTIKAAWHQVAEALWKRYPNPHSKHVLSADTVARRLEGQKLISKRLLTKTNKAPKWMERFVGGAGSAAAIVEESIVDISRKTFTTYTRNINFAKLMSVEEKCVYYQSPENKDWTCCSRKAWITCGVMGVSRVVEKFGVSRYHKNAIKAELGLEYVLDQLFHLPLLLTSNVKVTNSDTVSKMPPS